MARLIANGALGDRVPPTIGRVRIEEIDLGTVTLVAPFRGQEAAVAAALASGFPGPGQVTRGPDGSRAIWAGPGRALVCGAAVTGLEGMAALVDQSDGSICLRVTGPGVEDMLARLVPLDLRVAGFAPGQTARTLVNHMSASVTRVGPDAFEIMVMRSMAVTLLAEVTEAARMVAARG